MSLEPAAALVVLGASGFLGSNLLRAASATWTGPVVAVSRRALSVPAGVRAITASIADPASFVREVPPGAVVVNLIYGWTAGYEGNLALARDVANLCSAVAAERLVHVSTAGVTGQSGSTWITEATEPRPTSAYQKEKMAVEEWLHAWSDREGHRLVVLRPTAVFGSGGLALRKLAGQLRRRPWPTSYAQSCLFGRRTMNLVPVENISAAILFVAQSDRALVDRLYLVGADEAPENNFHDVERALRRGLGLASYPVPVLPLPSGFLAFVLRRLGRLTVDFNARFSSARLRAAGFEPPLTFAEALERYAAGVARELDARPAR